MGKRYMLDLFEGHYIDIFLYSNVTNAKTALDRLRNFELEIALINPQYICDVAQILAAASRAMYASQTGSLVTRNVHSELVFALSGSKNISSSLSKFGIKPESQSVILVTFDASSEKLADVSKVIEGKDEDLSQLSSFFQQDATVKLYGITASELQLGSVLKAILNRISLRDI